MEEGKVEVGCRGLGSSRGRDGGGVDADPLSQAGGREGGWVAQLPYVRVEEGKADVGCRCFGSGWRKDRWR
jgi:hypothetical protein